MNQEELTCRNNNVPEFLADNYKYIFYLGLYKKYMTRSINHGTINENKIQAWEGIELYKEEDKTNIIVIQNFSRV